jgi:hypothetical protein
MIDLPTRLRAGAAILLQCPEHVRMNGDHVPMDANLHRRADEAAEAAEEVERLRAEVALLQDSARKLYDIAASGAEWMRRRRMLDEMAMESFEEHG